MLGMGKTGARGSAAHRSPSHGRGVRALDSKREDWKLEGVWFMVGFSIQPST